MPATVELLEDELARRSAALGHIQTITKTFVALSLNERDAICDTLLALVCSFFEFEHGVILLCNPETHEPELAASYGIDDPERMLDAAARATWSTLFDDRVAQHVDADDVRSRWPDAPACFAAGLASVTIDIRDRAVGLIAVSGKRIGEVISPLDVEVLAMVGGLAALFVANGDAYQAQQRLFAEVELQAEAARLEAEHKQKTLLELDAQLLLIEQQRLEIRELSTPILEVWDHVLVLPVIGTIDARRSLDIMENLLGEIVRRQAKFAIVDVTGVEVVDTEAANYLTKVINAAALLGTRCVLTGIRPAVAQTLVSIGIDLSSLVTRADLRRGLDYCIDALAKKRPNRR